MFWHSTLNLQASWWRMSVDIPDKPHNSFISCRHNTAFGNSTATTTSWKCNKWRSNEDKPADKKLLSQLILQTNVIVFNNILLMKGNQMHNAHGSSKISRLLIILSTTEKIPNQKLWQVTLDITGSVNYHKNMWLTWVLTYDL